MTRAVKPVPTGGVLRRRCSCAPSVSKNAEIPNACVGCSPLCWLFGVDCVARDEVFGNLSKPMKKTTRKRVEKSVGFDTEKGVFGGKVKFLKKTLKKLDSLSLSLSWRHEQKMFVLHRRFWGCRDADGYGIKGIGRCGRLRTGLEPVRDGTRRVAVREE